MKNILPSLASICISFLVTILILNATGNNSKENNLSTEVTGLESSNIEDNTTTTRVSEKSVSQDFSDTLLDYDTWKTYDKDNIDLTTNFIGVDLSGNEISKKEFLEKLKTGNYASVKLFDAEYMYQLYSIGNKADERISKYIKTSSNAIYSYYLKEGRAFPEFSFIDLNDNLYTSENTKGKTLVIECWFVQCTQCIGELPIKNDLYDRYEGHDNVLFLGLAFDTPDKLKKFLSKKEYRYPVIPNQKDFIKNKIGAVQYPTHIIVDQYGDIKKMVNNIESLSIALDNIINEDFITEDM